MPAHFVRALCAPTNGCLVKKFLPIRFIFSQIAFHSDRLTLATQRSLPSTRCKSVAYLHNALGIIARAVSTPRTVAAHPGTSVQSVADKSKGSAHSACRSLSDTWYKPRATHPAFRSIAATLSCTCNAPFQSEQTNAKTLQNFSSRPRQSSALFRPLGTELFFLLFSVRPHRLLRLRQKTNSFWYSFYSIDSIYP